MIPHPEQLATLIRRSTINAWMALQQVESEDRAFTELREAMVYPIVGDWVVEIDSALRSPGKDIDCVGKLLEVNRSRVPIGSYDEYDAEDAGRSWPKRLEYVIETIDGRTVKIETGKMIAVPTDIYKRP